MTSPSFVSMSMGREMANRIIRRRRVQHLSLMEWR